MRICNWVRLLSIILLVVSISFAAGCITINAPGTGSSGQSDQTIETPPEPTPPPAQEPPSPSIPEPNIEMFTASPDTVTPGQMSTLNWSVTGAETVTIDNGIGSVALIGSRTVQPQGTVTLTLTATNEAGSVTATTTITVLAGTTNSNPVVQFTATHLSGTSWQLNWNVTNSTEQVIEPDIGPVAPSGSTTVTVPSGHQKTYRLTATNSWGWAYWDVILMSP